MDVAFLALLFLASTSGLLLLALRETAAMGVLLIVHLGIVLALFIYTALWEIRPRGLQIGGAGEVCSRRPASSMTARGIRR